MFRVGHLVEKALALDDVFIISMVFTDLAPPRWHRHLVTRAF